MTAGGVLPGTTLSGRYLVEREIGRGGMATVLLARDLRHGRPVAVKVMQRDVVSPLGAQRFLQEIQFAARLTHPHILGVHDSGEADGVLFYVMPFVEGETLRARLVREGPLPIAEAVRLLRELADALAYAHANGVVHRDLKPENVLLASGHAVVADFGIAKAVAAGSQFGAGEQPGLTGTGMSVGTPAYMAPEQAAGDRTADHRADLYVFGVLAYELLAGVHPFQGRSSRAMMAAHLTESPTALDGQRPGIPPALAALVAQLLAKEPSERPASAQAVLQVLDAVSATPTPTPASAAPQDRPRRWRAGLAAAALLLAAGGGVYARFHQPGTSARAPISTVAVLPFANVGGNADDEYFSVGMTDELAHALVRVPGLRIAGRSATYAFKGSTLTAQEIGRALDVGALIEGTVRRSGDRLRVTTQLVGTNDGKVLWDSVYESRSSDVFGVQDQFTRAVVAALTPALGSQPTPTPTARVARGTNDLEAYQLYLQGRFHWLARGEANVRQSIDEFERAIARDPSFARAHAGLAQAYGVLVYYVQDSTESLPGLVGASADRALALDSTLADAWIAKAFHHDLMLRYADAEVAYRRAIALEPSNASARLGLGFLLTGMGRTDEALRELARATALDPMVPSAGTALGLTYAFARRGPEAVAEARRVLAFDSLFVLALRVQGIGQLIIGEREAGLRSLERIRALSPKMPGAIGWLLWGYTVAGNRGEVERIRAELRRPGGDASGGIDAAYAEFVTGNREPLIRALSTDAGVRHWQLSYLLGCNPMLDPLWSDERFKARMRALAVQPCPLARRTLGGTP